MLGAVGLFSILAVGCVNTTRHANSIGECSPGQKCHIAGILHVYRSTPAWSFVIQNKTHCAKIALPREVYPEVGAWDGQRVSVLGLAFAQPASDDGDMVALSFTFKEREMALGICDYGIGIFASELENAHGQIVRLPD